MKKFYLFLAAVATMTLAGCVNEEFVGYNSPTDLTESTDGSIGFGFKMQNTTRADIAGVEAATLLGNGFYVMGTKGTEATTSPSPDVVFDNYLVHFKANTAGQTESNTANWEYVGVTPGSGYYTNWVKTGSYTSQTIKYWDYSAAQYDFFAFSTGNKAAVFSATPTDAQIGVTAMAHGTALAGATAYTLYIPTVAALKEAYITDIKEVVGTGDYGKEVQLQFKNVGAKVRVALYETIPGYSVKDVKFYASTSTPIKSTADGYVAPTANATLISSNASGFTTKGSIAVSFPYIGTGSHGQQAYDKASAVVSTTTGVQTQQFGALDNQLVTRYDGEDTDGNKHYLGRSLPAATFAGSAIADPAFASTEDAQFYQTVFPAASTSYALTLRVDYTLVSIDGSKEEIKVYGANAVVPATYTKWLPNYAYTYIFKISDNSNGWTSQTDTDPQGLYPITFDAVVAEATDATDDQKTITTVANYSITTYQQNHEPFNDDPAKQQNEYSITTAKDIYVQVMNNTLATPALVATLAADKSNSLIYELSEDASEAKVMDALQMRTTDVGTVATANVTGRNGLELTNKASLIANNVTQIINGADDQPITVPTGSAAKITIASLTAGKSYAYVYIPTASSKEVNQFEPIVPGASKINESAPTHTYYALTTVQVDAGTAVAAGGEAPNEDYVYFSVTKNGTGTITYSYISPLGKTLIPEGCKKVAKSTVLLTTKTGDDPKVDDTFYFDKYITNNGEYAVKVIKVVA